MAKEAKSNKDIDFETKKARRQFENAQKDKKKSRQNKIIIACIVVLLAAFLVLVVNRVLKENGVYGRHTTVASTENFEVTENMMSFYFNSSVYQYLSYYQSDADNYNKFVEDIESYGTNYTSIMNGVKSQVEQYLTLAELAKEKGIELDDSDYKAIDETIKSYDDNAVEYGYESTNSYLSRLFTTGMKTKDIRAALELQQLASKCTSQLAEEYKAKYTEDECSKYFDENSEEYLYVDYLTQEFSDPVEPETEVGEDAVDAALAAGEDAVDAALAAGEELVDEVPAAGEELVDEAGDEAAEEAKKASTLADELAACADAEAFKAYMKDYFTEEAKASLAEDEELDEEAIDTKVKALSKTKQARGNISDEDLKTWLFAEETKEGETKIVKDEATGKYTVYMLEKKEYKDTEKTKNAYVILLADSTNDGNAAEKAADIKAEWEKGEKTEASFKKLTEKYSEGATELQENIVYSDDVAGNWLYDAERKVGDVEVLTDSTGIYSYVVYFAGEGEEGWLTTVKAAKASDDYAEDLKAFQVEHMVNDDKENPSIVTFDDEKIMNIAPAKISSK